MKHSRPPLARTLLFALILCLAPPAAQPARAQEPSPARQFTTSVLLRWPARRGVGRYRLQVATDARFRDIVFDVAVVGLEHRVTGLAPGTYYWRVAPAEGETGTFSRPTPIVVTSEAPPAPVARPAPPVIDASLNAGWRTATGEVVWLVPGALRAGSSGAADLVSVNRDGMVHALNGTTGVALWTARYRPEARRGEPTGSLVPVTFSPLVVPVVGSNFVVVAYDGGVRALRGESGREAWRAPLAAGIAAGGSAADVTGDGRAELAVVAGSPSTLYLLDAETGRVVAERKLSGAAVDAPFPYVVGNVRGVAVATVNGVVEVVDARGQVVATATLEGPVMTAPLVVESSMGPLMTVGTEKGLDALDARELKPLGRISTESDTVRGRLSAVDLDADGSPEIVMLTKKGKVAVVNTSDGKIRWFADGASDAAVASFADLNGDGTLDVLVPGGATFALGFSGRDGTTVWKVEETGRPAPSAVPASTVRVMTLVAGANDATYAVGGEPSRVGVRAVELPKSSRRAVTRN